MCSQFKYLILAIAMTCTLAASQQRPTGTRPGVPEGRREPLTNSDVIKMVQSGKRESDILATIRSSGTNFDLSTQGCKLLVGGHVSRSILNAMGGPSGPPCASSSASSKPQPVGTGTLLGSGNPTLLAGGSKQTPLTAAAPSSGAGRVPSGNGGSSAANGSVSQKNPGPGGASAKAARAPATLSAPKLSRKLVNPKAGLQDAAIIAVLRKQRNAADAETAAMKLGIRSAGAQGNLGPSQTMAATTGGGATNQPAAMPAGVRSLSTGSTAHPGANVTLPPHFNSLAITCSNDPTMRVLTVSGGPTPAIFTPDPKYNFYTITGCSFGSPGTNSKAYIYLQGTFRADFQIQEWNDNWIKISLDQNISGVDDQNNVTFVIQNNDGKQWTRNGYRFYAARQAVLLSKIPQNDFSLNHFRPDDSLTRNWKATYTSGSSPSVVPNLPDLSAEVHWELISNSDNPVGGKDMYDFSHLHSTFALDSALLEWKDLSCTDPNYNQFAASKNNWSIDWNGASGLQVSWQGQICKNTLHSCGGAFQGDCFANVPESNYGINVWVVGPRCIDPWTGQKDETCMSKFQKNAGS